jgi:hypothetical protein
MTTLAFMPYGPTATIAVSSSSQSTKVGSRDGGNSIRICNLGTATVWIKFGDSTVAATTSDIPIPGNGFVEIMRPVPTQTTQHIYVAAIAAAATGNITFTLGEGV